MKTPALYPLKSSNLDDLAGVLGPKQPLKSVSLVDLNQTEKVTERFV